MDEENDGERNDPDGKDKDKEDDVDIYGDLETVGSDANANNVIERFNKLFSPKNRITEDDIMDDDLNGEDEEDVGLYDDLNTFEKQLKAEELEAKIELLEQKLSHLDQQNAQLKTEMEKVNKANLALRRNISSLYKTAKAESERKDRQLKELQRSYDALLFKRGGPKAVPPPPAPEIKQNGHHDPVIHKESAKSNLVTLEEGSDCTVQMGKVSISFSVESCDFQKRRFERLEAEARRVDKEDAPSVAKESDHRRQRPREKETAGSKPTNKEDRSHEKRPIKEAAPINESTKTNGHISKPPEPAEENLEDGEVVEEATEPEPTDQVRRRSRSPPSSAKRKRSPSVERRHLRDRLGEPPVMRPINRRPQRSPAKASSSFHRDADRNRSRPPPRSKNNRR